MRKLKKIHLAQNQILNAQDMKFLEGGDYISFQCNHEYQACAILGGDGVYTGTCVYISGPEIGTQLICKKN
jgi:natural product precursor